MIYFSVQIGEAAYDDQCWNNDNEENECEGKVDATADSGACT